MLVHCLFGAKSSPSCASFALRKVADDNETHASPVTVLTVKRNFYVDNCLKSVKGVTENDEFEIKVELKQRPATRRGILSMTSQVFDPLGMVQPQILPAKKLMQRFCQLNLGWDDKIPTDLERQWTKWLHELPKLEAISIPRWFHPFSELDTVELHCFC